MKKLTTILLISLGLASCGPGRWVGGNAINFQKRAEHRMIPVTPSVPIAYEKVQGKYVWLTERPGPLDSIVIAIKKPIL